MVDSSLVGLFVSAFLSSTLLPGGSEVVLVYLASEGDKSLVTIWWVASLGNTLGGMTSWLIGYLISRRYPAQSLVKPNHVRALNWIQRWGSPVLLLSWLPLVGDALCVVAGWLRVHWLISLVMIWLGKAARYALLIYLASSV